ncbi:hypothetical protein RQP46_000502 [Phenoliferia psychrophenolica]
MSQLSTGAILAKLEQYRVQTVRAPLEVATLGGLVIERGWTNSRSEEVWTVMEQIAVAAVECGRLDLAEVCATRLSSRFPDSPRVAVLLGTILEGKGLVLEAKSFYEATLSLNESDVAIRKRLIALHLHAPLLASKEKGIELLVEYLDAVYNDPEGWAELATVYASLHLYAQSLSALSHLVLLLPHNPYHLLRHAETAYTLGDYQVAYKEMLRVIEMSDGVTGQGGVGRRAAMGVKLCIARLSHPSSSSTSSSSASDDKVLKPQKLNDVDLLVSKLVLDAYAKTPGAVGVDVVRKWIGGTA